MTLDPALEIPGALDLMSTAEPAETWRDTALPWASSFMMHAGIAIVAAFACYAVAAPAVEKDDRPIIPIAVPGVTEISQPFNPGGTESRPGCPKIDIPLLNGSDPYGTANGDISKILGESSNAANDAFFIGVCSRKGPGGTHGVGGDSEVGLGAPSGKFAVGGPSIFATGRPSMKTVYLLDHSGSMLDTFDFLRNEVKKRISSQQAIQKYSVIMFSEDVEVLGADRLLPATNENKRDLALKMDGIRAQGKNDDLLEPFQKGFEKAFAMKPETIVFLTDGAFDPQLVPIVKALNKDGKVHVSTIAYVRISPDAELNLKKIAADNGGRYKFVSEQDLGR